MRPQMDLRARRACAAVAALGLTYTAVTDTPLKALASGPAAAADALTAALDGPHVLRYGQRVTVSGRLPGGQAGVPLALEYQAGGSSPWTTEALTRSVAGGSFRLSAPVTRSGALRVATADQATVAQAHQPRGVVADPSPSGSGGAASAPIPFGVRAALGLQRRRMDVLAGQRAVVAGALAPRVPGQTVALQVRAGRGWTTVARARTGAQGRYRLRYAAHQTGSRPARLSFAGDGASAGAVRPLGRLNVYRAAAASWYGPGGTTACGESLTAGTMGVANKTLPCGTMVTLRYGSHTVRVPVIDRGPYVAGREFDLTQATKDALGFGDTGEVWTTS